MITIYSLPTCGKCKMIKTKLVAKNISFNDCQDIEKLKSLDINYVPVLEKDNGSLIHDIGEIVDYVNSL